MGTLDFTKELMGQFNKLATDEAKDKKKIMRKELQEKSRDELSKVTMIDTKLSPSNTNCSTVGLLRVGGPGDPLSAEGRDCAGGPQVRGSRRSQDDWRAAGPAPAVRRDRQPSDGAEG